MEETKLTKDQILQMMFYNTKEVIQDPGQFDYFPPPFGQEPPDGWSMLSKSIFRKDKTLIRAINKVQDTQKLHNGSFDPLGGKSPKPKVAVLSRLPTSRKRTKRMTVRDKACSTEKPSKNTNEGSTNQKLARQSHSVKKSATRESENISKSAFFRDISCLLNSENNNKVNSGWNLRNKHKIIWKKFLVKHSLNPSIKSQNKACLFVQLYYRAKRGVKSTPFKKRAAKTTNIASGIYCYRTIFLELIRSRTKKSPNFGRYQTHRITKIKTQTEENKDESLKLAKTDKHPSCEHRQSKDSKNKPASVFMKYLLKPKLKQKFEKNKCKTASRTMESSVAHSQYSLNPGNQTRIRIWEPVNKNRYTPKTANTISFGAPSEQPFTPSNQVMSTQSEVRVRKIGSKREEKRAQHNQRLRGIYRIKTIQ
ncbi:unnamed protein product [Moneuplotes crassus]|uniref:Uncharacterized protein n=1 Tax=Euplotes crassus TaxID=5936 RepID=A0AAD1U866_EUPCR|nr:unnamed protein product [Moneuplotes crassus]